VRCSDCLVHNCGELQESVAHRNESKGWSLYESASPEAPVSKISARKVIVTDLAADEDNAKLITAR
jgi:hypothetical protein